MPVRYARSAGLGCGGILDVRMTMQSRAVGSDTGDRLYSEADVERVRIVQRVTLPPADSPGPAAPVGRRAGRARTQDERPRR